MAIRIRIDRARCIVAGFCLYAAPQVLEPMQDGKPGVREEFREGSDPSVGLVPDEFAEYVKAAADSCPVKAISVERT